MKSIPIVLCALFLLSVSAIAYEDGYGAITHRIDGVSENILHHTFAHEGRYIFRCLDQESEGLLVGKGMYIHYNCPEGYPLDTVRFYSPIVQNDLSIDLITPSATSRLGGYHTRFVVDANINQDQSIDYYIDVVLPWQYTGYYKILYGNDLEHWDMVAVFPRPVGMKGSQGIYRLYGDETARYFLLMERIW